MQGGGTWEVICMAERTPGPLLLAQSAARIPATCLGSGASGPSSEKINSQCPRPAGIPPRLPTWIKSILAQTFSAHRWVNGRHSTLIKRQHRTAPFRSTYAFHAVKEMALEATKEIWLPDLVVQQRPRGQRIDLSPKSVQPTNIGAPSPVRYKEQRRREDPTLNWIKVRETRSIKKAPIRAITSDVASARPTRMKKSLVGCPYLFLFENKQWNTCESMPPRLLPFLSRGHGHAWPCAGDSTHTPGWSGTPP